MSYVFTLVFQSYFKLHFQSCIFRLAEQQAEESTSNIELLRRSLIDKAEEISHLRKELDETRNVLNEEKLLNGNIKTRKVNLNLKIEFN